MVLNIGRRLLVDGWSVPCLLSVDQYAIEKILLSSKSESPIQDYSRRLDHERSASSQPFDGS